MKYMGSKARIAKHITPIMIDDAQKNGISNWVEPFVGGLNVIKTIPDAFNRIGCDNNIHLIEMYRHIQKFGFDGLPMIIPKELYDEYRTAYRTMNPKYDLYMIGWVGFMASANGRFYDGGYSGVSNTKIGTVRDYVSESIRGIITEWSNTPCDDITFDHKCYLDTTYSDSIIYCDPPYKDTKQYSTSKNFDHESFYDWCRKQSEHNIVYVSEYNMPNDFECVWQMNLNGSIGISKKTPIERLYKIKAL